MRNARIAEKKEESPFQKQFVCSPPPAALWDQQCKQQRKDAGTYDQLEQEDNRPSTTNRRTTVPPRPCSKLADKWKKEKGRASTASKDEGWQGVRVRYPPIWKNDRKKKKDNKIPDQNPQNDPNTVFILSLLKNCLETTNGMVEDILEYSLNREAFIPRKFMTKCYLCHILVDLYLVQHPKLSSVQSK